MAALIKHVLSKNNQILNNSLISNSSKVLLRFYANKKYKVKIKKYEAPKCRKLESTGESLASKGFLRCQKNYKPAEDLESRLDDVHTQIIGPVEDAKAILDPSLRYSLFNACYNEFNHSIPNSILHLICCYDDLLQFYLTPVDTTLPLEKMKKMELPPNLHIQYEPLRFLPDEDLKFDGQTAFPKSNTLVTGLRTKKKFKGHKVIEPWQAHG